MSHNEQNLQKLVIFIFKMMYDLLESDKKITELQPFEAISSSCFLNNNYYINNHNIAVFILSLLL